MKKINICFIIFLKESWMSPNALTNLNTVFSQMFVFLLWPDDIRDAIANFNLWRIWLHKIHYANALKGVFCSK